MTHSFAKFAAALVPGAAATATTIFGALAGDRDDHLRRLPRYASRPHGAHGRPRDGVNMTTKPDGPLTDHKRNDQMSHGGRHDPVQHVNDDHAEDLLAAARAFCGHPDAIAARAERIDGEGMDLVVDSPHGPAEARLIFTEPVADGDAQGLRAAFADLALRARTALAADSGD